MRRRLFIQSAPAAMAFALTGCGGGGGGTEVSAAACSSTAAASHLAAITSSVPGLAYPFGSRLKRYVAGITPTIESNSAMDDRVKRSYDAWKAENVVSVD